MKIKLLIIATLLLMPLGVAKATEDQTCEPWQDYKMCEVQEEPETPEVPETPEEPTPEVPETPKLAPKPAPQPQVQSTQTFVGK